MCLGAIVATCALVPLVQSSVVFCCGSLHAQLKESLVASKELGRGLTNLHKPGELGEGHKPAGECTCRLAPTG